MQKSFDEKQVVKFGKLLQTLTKESEFFGLLGVGYPESFYKVYVRAAPGKKWWRVEGAHGASVSYDPVRKQEKLPVKSRVAVIWGGLGDVLSYEHIECEALDKLYARATALVGPPKVRVVAKKTL